MILFSFYFPFIFLPLFYLHRVTEREEPERSFPESKVPQCPGRGSFSFQIPTLAAWIPGTPNYKKTKNNHKALI